MNSHRCFRGFSAHICLFLLSTAFLWLGGVVRADDDGVCAKVGLRLDQSAVMTRTAFRATLELSNNDPGTPLADVAAAVEIKDAQGDPANARFAIEPPTLENINSVSGNGALAPSSKAIIRWLLIPVEDAAPSAPADFFVGGQFSYTLSGIPAQVTLEPVKITVYPDAALELKYFHQRDVFSDDPFTPEIEPAQPYSLAVMVKNRGAGAAKSLKISSGQPQVVSNDKGLIIDFALRSTSLDGTNIPNSLALDFGRIEPGVIKTAEWQFTSTLQGFFRDFSATFQHEDTLGDIRLSTIKSVSIHEMAHIVDAPYAFSDSKADFLVNDMPDPDHLPDVLYLSDGSTNPVQVVDSYVFDGVPSEADPQVQLTTSASAGWIYLRIPEPSAGQLALTGIRRSDGIMLRLGTNVWSTDRLFLGPGQRPIETNLLHLLDYDSTGSYTLIYGGAVPVDTTPPVSAVAALPPSSYPNVFVSWTGHDDEGGSGLSAFDIFVSVNDGPFQLWLAQTPLPGSVYPGVPGNHYKFYSIATDHAGNRELPPGAPDAGTTVNLTNQPPSMTLPATIVVNEGQVVTITNRTTDPDVPADLLTFSLGSGTPPGLIINPATGLITWITSEAHGPGTNVIRVRVTDNGQPSLAATGTVTVIVNEVNTAPAMATISDRTINEGQLLTITPSATDLDLPAQRLTYSLGAGAPEGAAVDTTTGTFTWRPATFQGGTTNPISIAVRDDGPGHLTATRTFSVIVRNTRSDFIVHVGTTNVFAGQTSSVPLVLDTGADLHQTEFILHTRTNRLGDFLLSRLAPAVASAAIQPLGNERLRVSIAGRPANPLQGLLTLAHLSFKSVLHEQSAVVPINISGVQGTRTAGPLLDDAEGRAGRVFIIGREPILDAAVGTNQLRFITVYGHSGRTYILETNSVLEALGWAPSQRVSLQDSFARLAHLPSTELATFYRLRELNSSEVPLTIAFSASSVLIGWTANCHGCILEEAESLSQAAWRPSEAQATLVNDRYTAIVPAGAPAKFYRLRGP